MERVDTERIRKGHGTVVSKWILNWKIAYQKFEIKTYQMLYYAVFM